MTSDPCELPDSAARQPLFLTTHWSVVLAARNTQAPAEAEKALESLCRAYWLPLYVYVRRQGNGEHDAQDLTQAFFARLLEKDYLQAAEQEKGRLRTFLIVAIQRFLLNEWDRARAFKRGGHILHISMEGAAERYRAELVAETLPADVAYERRWAMVLLEQAMERLRASYVDTGREAEYECLKSFLTADRGAVSYPEIARALQTTEGAARVAMHRLRKRFRQMFRDEVAGTVANADDVDDELRYIASILNSG